MKLNKIAVFGSTGAQGQPVVRELLERGIDVRAIARSKERIVELYGKAVEPGIGELSELTSTTKALDGVDGAFFHLPLFATAKERQKMVENIVAAAEIVELPKLVFTTSGFTDPRLSASKLVTANIAAEKAVLSSSTPSVVLKPTVYLENLLQPYKLDEIQNQGTLTYPLLPADRKISWTSLIDQAKMAIAALETDGASGKSYYIASAEPLSGDELAAAISQVIRKPVQYRPQEPAEFATSLIAVFGEVIGTAVSEMYEEVKGQPQDWGIVDLEPVISELSVSPTSTADWLSKHVWGLRLNQRRSGPHDD